LNPFKNDQAIRLLFDVAGTKEQSQHGRVQHPAAEFFTPSGPRDFNGDQQGKAKHDIH
jgi:hypothetical protein